MKNFGKMFWILSVVVIFFAIAGCKGKGTFEDTGAGPSGAPPPAADADGDGVPDATDNCPNISNSDQADSNENGVGDACEGEAPQTVMIEVTSVKILKQDNAEIDLLSPASPIPLRPQYIEVTYSAAVDCEVIKSNVSLMLNDAQVPDVMLSCPEETKLRIAPAKNFVPRSDYKIHFAAWEGNPSFAGREDLTFRTMTKGDVNGDSVPDIAVGAPGQGRGTGAIHVYSGDSGFPLIRSFQSTYAFAKFGTSISIENDINGDGYADIVVGAPGYNSNSGAVVFYSGFEFANTTPSLRPTSIEPGDAGAEFGQSMAVADMNGDGWPDIIIGAPGYNSDSGAVYVYDGRSFGLIRSVITRGALNTRFGYSVAITDINGDGTPEIIIGMPSKPGMMSYITVINGKPFIERGAQEVLCDLGGDTGTQFGYSLAAAGDINGDEIPDIIVGEPGANSGLGRVGILDGRYILDRSVPASMTSAHIIPAALCTVPPARFGESVVGGSDLNGNGVPEVIFGAPGCNSNKGAIFIYELNAARTAFLPLRYLPMSSTVTGVVKFGSSISLMGDINADEVEELIIGAPLRDDKGSVYVYSGKSLGLGGAPESIGSRLNGPSAGAQFGTSVNGGQ